MQKFNALNEQEKEISFIISLLIKEDHDLSILEQE